MTKKPKKPPAAQTQRMNLPAKLPAGVSVAAGGEAVDINPAMLAAPQWSMTATHAWAERRGPTVQLCFGQGMYGDDKILAALLIDISASHLNRTLRANSSTPGGDGEISFYDILHGYYLREIAGSENKDDVKAVLHPFEPPSQRTQVETAHLVLFAFSEQSAEARFYYLSANDFQQLRRGQNVDLVTGRVQVSMSTSLMYHLFLRMLELTQDTDASGRNQ